MDDKISVSRKALADLLMWCEDVIDFKDESDAWVAAAFDELSQTLAQRSR
jgi:hypothetical protein